MNPYLRLMRLDKPIGILLLWYPTAFALWLAHPGSPSLRLIAIFFLGTVIMRSAGCIVNDWADRDIDPYVHRTAKRPLATGELSTRQALYLLFVLLLGALILALQLPMQCWIYVILALVLTWIYPFCKRFINAPQLVLSLAFSIAIPMVYVAYHAPFTRTMWILLMINIFWVIAYDTIYAMVDREDDLKINVRSTAILFGRFDTLWVVSLLSLMHLLWLLICTTPTFLIFFGVGSFILVWQCLLIRHRAPSACFHAFLWNAAYGMVMWLACSKVPIIEL